MGKRYSKGQDIGAIGEAAFRRRAKRIGLLPTKVEEDVGVDFWCQIRGPFIGGLTTVGGAIVGACVRSTQVNDARIVLNRSDVEQILLAQFPIFLALVTLDESDDSDRVYVKTLDSALVDHLLAFLDSEKATLSFTPRSPGFVAIADSRPMIDALIQPGVALERTIQIQTSRARRFLAAARIEVRLGQQGPRTVIWTSDIAGAFDSSGDGEARILQALFGRSELIADRLASIAPHTGIRNIVENLPHPIALLAPATTSRGMLAVGSSRAPLSVEVRHAAGWLGFIHESGFSIRISEPQRSDGHVVHFIETGVDPEAPLELANHSDLTRFLLACREGEMLRYGPTVDDLSDLFTVEHCSDLLRFAAFTWAYNQIAGDQRRHLGILSGVPCNEVLNGATFWAHVVAGTFQGDFEWGFSLVDEWIEADSQEWVLLPVCFNLHGTGIVLWLRSAVHLLKVNEQICGLRIRSLSFDSVETRNEPFAKRTESPEIVVCRDWASIQLSEAEPTATRDVSSWRCQMLRTNDADG